MFRNDRKFKCLCPALSTRTSFAFRPVNSTSCILRAIVNPSHRSPDNPYKAWVAVKSNGQIPSECNWCCLPAKSPLCTLAHCRSSCTLQDSSTGSTLAVPCETPGYSKNSKSCAGTQRVTEDSSVLKLAQYRSMQRKGHLPPSVLVPEA